MIRVHRLNGKEIVLNAEKIQSVETTPDTMITLTNGATILVQDSVNDVVDKVKAYKRETSRFLSLEKAS